MMKYKAQEVFIRQRKGLSKENMNMTLFHHTPGLQRGFDAVLLFNEEGWKLWREGGGASFSNLIFLSKATASFNICTNEKWTKV